MNYVEAPNEYGGNGPSIFLAGSISDPANWQSRLTESLTRTDLAVFNPRRPQFPVANPAEERRQIEWERRYLSRADLVVFWLTPPTMCPIALFELGACCESGVPLVVGIDPNYALSFDMSCHLHLRRQDVKVLDNLDDVGRATISYFASTESTR
jgi:hypothetical protein